MKKLLLSLMSLTVTISAVATVIACDKNKNTNSGGNEKPNPDPTPTPEPTPPVDPENKYEITFENYIKKFKYPIHWNDTPVGNPIHNLDWDRDEIYLNDTINEITDEIILNGGKWKDFFGTTESNYLKISNINETETQNEDYDGFYDVELTQSGIEAIKIINYGGIYTKQLGFTWDTNDLNIISKASAEAKKLKITGSIRVYFVFQDPINV
ncbi:hypothetical protein [Williamsoniiplasma lucivorax]|uniref:Lipoprotein n=1 Tax=Williamsoniiplasma lucivorax TaxID=209274 RepID=A0A2S5RF99_9MOLU|nr:hypothetical protein [Williamsoniiplasma lucivorax]PPE05968.1 hypothetical protein ELUCI_v1c02590 [Williamsoniiplasma lucivorax]